MRLLSIRDLLLVDLRVCKGCRRVVLAPLCPSMLCLSSRLACVHTLSNKSRAFAHRQPVAGDRAEGWCGYVTAKQG
jgi:hypothetical protein